MADTDLPGGGGGGPWPWSCLVLPYTNLPVLPALHYHICTACIAWYCPIPPYLYCMPYTTLLSTCLYCMPYTTLHVLPAACTACTALHYTCPCLCCRLSRAAAVR